MKKYIATCTKHFSSCFHKSVNLVVKYQKLVPCRNFWAKNNRVCFRSAKWVSKHRKGDGWRGKRVTKSVFGGRRCWSSGSMLPVVQTTTYTFIALRLCWYIISLRKRVHARAFPFSLRVANKRGKALRHGPRTIV